MSEGIEARGFPKSGPSGSRALILGVAEEALDHIGALIEAGEVAAEERFELSAERMLERLGVDSSIPDMDPPHLRAALFELLRRGALQVLYDIHKERVAKARASALGSNRVRRQQPSRLEALESTLGVFAGLAREVERRTLMDDYLVPGTNIVLRHAKLSDIAFGRSVAHAKKEGFARAEEFLARVSALMQLKGADSGARVGDKLTSDEVDELWLKTVGEETAGAA